MALSSSMRRNPLVAFFLVAYGFSWTFWVSAQLLFPPSLPPDRRVPALALSIVGTFGPFVAAVLVSWATGTGDEFKERLLRWRVAPRWYLVAVGVPVVAVTVSYGIYRALGGPALALSRTPPMSGLAVLFAFTLFAGGGNEEPGWRGFALPRLQYRYGPVRGTLVLAVLWAGWHIPAFFDPTSTQSLLPPAAWALGVVATSLVLTWLFNTAAGSVPVVAVYHATFNVAGLWVLMGLPTDAAGEFYWIGIAVYGVLAVGLVLVTRSNLALSRDEAPAGRLQNEEARAQ